MREPPWLAQPWVWRLLMRDPPWLQARGQAAAQPWGHRLGRLLIREPPWLQARGQTAAQAWRQWRRRRHARPQDATLAAPAIWRAPRHLRPPRWPGCLGCARHSVMHTKALCQATWPLHAPPLWTARCRRQHQRPRHWLRLERRLRRRRWRREGCWHIFAGCLVLVLRSLGRARRIGCRRALAPAGRRRRCGGGRLRGRGAREQRRRHPKLCLKHNTLAPSMRRRGPGRGSPRPPTATNIATTA